jgi:hypothetical protein
MTLELDHPLGPGDEEERELPPETATDPDDPEDPYDTRDPGDAESDPPDWR